MAKDNDELFVVIRCCGLAPVISASRPMAIRQLGDADTMLKQDKERVVKFLEGNLPHLDNIHVRIKGSPGHYWSVVPGEVAK